MALTKISTAMISQDAASVDLNIDAGTLYIDSTNNRVGVGTTSPVYALHVHQTSNSQIQFTDNTSGSNVGDGLRVGWNGNVGQMWLFEDAALRFATNNTERVRIDSSGNLLIKKTSANNSIVGVELKADGSANPTVDGDTVARFNRLTSDGEIIRFQKDTTTVGSIFTDNSGDLGIGNDDTGLLFVGGSDLIAPWNPTGPASRDAVISLGNASNRFNNLYMAGTLYGPATFTIDPATHGDNTGTVVIAGNLQVDGTTTTINSTTLTVDDKLITLASGSANAAAANGAGIEVEISGATNPSLTYDGTNDEWDFNKNVNTSGTISAERLRVNRASATSDPAFIIEGLNNTNGTVQIVPNSNKGSNQSHIHHGSTGDWYIRSASSSGTVYIQDSGGTLSTGAITSSGQIEATRLYINVPDGGSSPAMTAYMNIYGYEGRGAGIKIRDSANSASNPSDREWFIGSGYQQSGFNIGYAADGSQSSYAAQNMFFLDTSGNATITGTISSGAITSSGNITATNQININSASYDNRQIGMDSNGFFIFNAADSRYDLKISDSGVSTFANTANFYGNGAAPLAWGDTSGVGALSFSGSNAIVRSTVSNADLIFQGNSGGFFEALRLDMSAGGDATFAGRLTVNGTAQSSFYGIKLSRSGTGLATPDLWGENSTLVLGTSSSDERLALSTSGATIYGAGTIKSDAGSGQAADLDFLSTNTSGFGSSYAIDSRIRSTAEGSSNAYSSKLQFYTNDSSNNLTERMQLNGTGDWIVSNTNPRVASQFTNQAGIGWYDADLHAEVATTSNRSALEIGKNNANDGDLVTFRKQSTVVGDIGTIFGDLYLGTGDTKLRFDDTNDAITPRGSGGSARNSAVSLGTSSVAFRSLNLSAADPTTSATSQIRFITQAGSDLADAAITTSDDSGGTDLLLGSNLRWHSGSLTRFNDSRSGSGIRLGYTGNMRFYTESGSNQPTERMVLDSVGNLLLYNGSPEFHFGTTSASHYNWRVAAQEALDTGFEIASGTQSAGSSALGDTYTTRFVIKASDGKVGIGGTSTSAAANVLLTTGTTSLGYVGMSLLAGTHAEEWRMYSSYNGSNEALWGVYRAADSSYKLIVHESGNVGIGTSSPYSGTGVTSLTINATSYPVLALRAGDTNYGIVNATSTYLNVGTIGSRAIIFTPNDTERLRISATAAELQLGGTTNAGFIDFDGTSLQLNTQRNPNTGSFVNTGRSQAGITLRGADGSSEIRFYTANSNNTTGTERVRIADDGKVAIGHGFTPLTHLHVNKGSTGHQPAANVEKNYVAINTDYNSAGTQGIYFSHLTGNWMDGSSGADSQYGMLFGYQNAVRGGLIYDHRGTEMMSLWSTYGDIRFMTADSVDGDGVPIDTNIKDRLHIKVGGNVGIGTDNPSAPLEVRGSMLIKDPDDGGAPAMTATLHMYGYEGRGVGIKLRDNTTSASGATDREWFVGTGYSQSNFNIGYAADGSQSSYAAQNKLTISTAGKVGIGTSGPDVHLQVHNNSSGDKTARFVNTGSGTQGITVGTATSDSAGRAVHVGHDNSAKGFFHSFNYGSSSWDDTEIKGAKVNLRSSTGYDMLRIGTNFWSLGGGATSHGRVRSYHHAVSVSAGTTIQLLTNNSGAHTDVNFLYWIEAYHSGRTYRTGVGTFGGYGLYTSNAGQGINLSIADVSTGVKRLEFVAHSSYTTVVYIGMMIFGDTALTVHNGTLADMI